MTKDLALAIGVMMTAGLFGGMLARKLKFPRVTGYILIGVLLSPSVLNLVPRATLDSLDIITNVSLAIIAYSIGGSLRMKFMRKLGRSIAWITPGESLGAWVIVTLMIVFFAPRIFAVPNATFLGYYFPMAFVIGSMAGATAPAATMAVIREYAAKGPFTTTLLSVVAIDDAVSVITFAIAVGIAQPLVSGGNISLYQMLGIPFQNIAQSIGIGAAFGFALIYIARLVGTRSLLLVVVLGMIMLCTGITNLLSISMIMANMVLGFVVRNRVEGNEPFGVIEGIEDVVFAIFFVMAGMQFDSSIIKTAGIMAALIIAGRFSGQYFGAMAGAKIARAPDNVAKYLGLALQPQAGVTIGLALLARSLFPTFGDVILNGFLASPRPSSSSIIQPLFSVTSARRILATRLNCWLIV